MPHNLNQNHLIIFARYPVPGKTKTRLIPLLGPLGAADCHRRLTEDTFITALSFLKHQSSSSNQSQSGFAPILLFDSNVSTISSQIRFYYDGGSTQHFKEWLYSLFECKKVRTDRKNDENEFNLLKNRIYFKQQANGDLGERMVSAIRDSFKMGAKKVVIIGTDLPDLNENHLENAFCALSSSEIVIGPSMDGGYWLIGLTEQIFRENKTESIFDGIEWGTDKVLSKTIEITSSLNLKVCQLDLLNDLDTPDDIVAYDPDMINNKLISVIIPSFNEAARISNAINSALHQNCEIVVVDGGSNDKTVDIAMAKGVRVINATKGRWVQQNIGAKFTKSEILLFLHADTLLPPDYAEALFMAFLNKRLSAGAFSFKTDSSHPFLRLISNGVNLRSRLLKLPYGDQALFFRRSIFESVGGFPQAAIAEDILLIRKLFKKKTLNKSRFAILPIHVTTSARRWNSIGILRTTIINIVILLGILLGIAPDRFVGLYAKVGITARKR